MLELISLLMPAVNATLLSTATNRASIFGLFGFFLINTHPIFIICSRLLRGGGGGGLLSFVTLIVKLPPINATYPSTFSTCAPPFALTIFLV